MKGNFSRLRFPQIRSDSAVLQQQGRVSLDEDWNAQVTLGQDILRDALKDLIGPAGTSDEKAFAITPLQSLVLDGKEQVLTLPGKLLSGGEFTLQVAVTILPAVTSGTIASLESGFRLYVTDTPPVSDGFEVMDEGGIDCVPVSDILHGGADGSDSDGDDADGGDADGGDADGTVAPPRVLVLDPGIADEALSLGVLPDTDLPLHIAVVYKEDPGDAAGVIKISFNLYLDGILQSRRVPPPDNTGSGASGKSLRIGAAFGAGKKATDFLAAEVDSVQLWSVALWDAALLSLLGRRLTGDEEGLAGYYLFGDGKGKTKVRNQVGNGDPQGKLAADAAVVQYSFWIAPGRYWVEGRRCVNPYTVAFTHQPNYPLTGNPLRPPGSSVSHLVYLDVWDRFLSALQDPSLREVALGGPDTTGRIENVWQAKVTTDKKPPTPPPLGTLKARRLRPTAGPVGNLLYRVEVAASGIAFAVVTSSSGDAEVPAELVQRAFDLGTVDLEKNTVMTETVADYLHFPFQQQLVLFDPNESPVGYQYNTVKDVDGDRLVMADVLDPELMKKSGLKMLPVASFKWSSQNGCIAFPVASIQDTTLVDGSPGGLVQLSGPGYNGFELSLGDWLELADDTSELRRLPEPLYQVVAVDPSALQITLKGWQSARSRVDLAPSQHPLLRLWNVTPDATGRRVGKPVQPIVADVWTELEHGIEVFFARSAGSGPAFYRSGDYWTMPVRDVSADSLEWPGGSLHPKALPPEGVIDVTAPLAEIRKDGTIKSRRLRIVPNVRPIP